MKPTLALSMIVRDAQRELGACLASCRSVVDEIRIADTGSTDDTAEIAKSFGAVVTNVPWTNDFAVARNTALQGIESEWILSLDADERLDPEAGIRLPALLEEQSVAGYQVTIRNYVLSAKERLWDRAAKLNDSRLEAAKIYPAYVEHQNVRLFRRDRGIYFVGRVHESVGPRVLQSGLKLGNADFCIHHFGLASDAETRSRKNILYRALGLQKIKDMPRDAQAHFELGLVELDNFSNAEGGLALFHRARNLNPKFAEAWFFEGVALVKLVRYDDALQSLLQAERLGHRTALVAEVAGEAYYNAGKFAEACDSYERARQRSTDDHDPSLQSKLGMAQVRAGKDEPGLRSLRQAIDAASSTPELHDRLIQSLVWLDRVEDAAAASDNKLAALDCPEAGDFLRSASLWFKVGNPARAAAILQVGLQMHPGEERLLQGLGQLAEAAVAGK
jgi:glycosyltransferase involved in cell wall biosynthesis